MSQLEKEIERKCRRIAERNNCELLKILSPNRTGIPDRLFIGPHVDFEPQFIWMEFKQSKKKTSPQQGRTLARLISFGHQAFKVDSVEQFCKITGLEE